MTGLAIVKETEVRKGRRLYGHLCELEDGQVIYLARRRHREIFRAGKASISAAMAEGEAAWAIDETTLYNLRARGVQVAGVRVIDTGDLYLALVSDFLDPRKARIKDYTERGGSRQRYLPLQHFTVSKGAVVLPESCLSSAF